MNVAAAVLAAGLGTRMGTPKPIVPAAGKPLASWIIETLLAVPLDPVLVITGHVATEVEAALASYPVQFVRNPLYATGMAGSIKAAVDAVPAETEALLIVPADMPMIELATLASLIAQAKPDRIVVPFYHGRRGHPVVFGSCFFGALAELKGDQGGRPVLERHATSIVQIPLDDEGILVDIDTKIELDRWLAGRKA